MHVGLLASSTEPSGLQALGLNFQALIVQLITFLFFFVLLEKFAIKPLLKKLNERRRVIDEGVELGLSLEKKQAHLDELVSKTLQEARQEADTIIEEGKKAARQTLIDAETAAKRKAEAILDAAQTKIKDDADRARQALENEVAGLVGDVAEAVIGQTFTEAKDKALIRESVKEQLRT